MAFLLAIETTTKNCSVALFKNSNLLQLREQNSDKYSHAEQLTVFIEEVIKNSNITLKEITQLKKLFKKKLANIHHARIEY